MTEEHHDQDQAEVEVEVEQEYVETEEHTVKGEGLLAKIKEIIHEGNVRRITIKNDEGHTLIEIPLTIGVVGALLLPVWAAIGTIAALAGRINQRVAIRREARRLVLTSRGKHE